MPRPLAIFSMVVFALSVPQRLGAEPPNFTPGHDSNQADSVTMTYDPTTGEATVRGNNVEITSFELESASHMFLFENIDPSFLVSPFDLARADKIFALRLEGTSELQLGAILPPQLPPEQVLKDLTVDGSLAPKGWLTDAPGGGPYLIIPEPSGGLLILIGLAVLGFRRRPRSL